MCLKFDKIKVKGITQGRVSFFIPILIIQKLCNLKVEKCTSFPFSTKNLEKKVVKIQPSKIYLFST